ncbi:hypothetical protein FRB94_000021 [Tulasnella sp. JGI-2019a]|nr:hypothetical protein FRB93_004499 [Tulasnella sp. JGI-2019a]KAG9015417.1 hypothetical protein FRB94_000021 [Tulasnella sp. JGI-2019a]KAG9037675.1 hypothetical protein FRB95_004521 [Tulasnella sp. JGI-2019a]
MSTGLRGKINLLGRVKESSRALTGALKNVQSTRGRKEKRSINDVLPPEVLEDVMKHAIFHSSWGAFEVLTLVCRLWLEFARRLEFVRLDLTGKWQINKLLQRVEDLRLPSGEIPRSPTRWLCVTSRLDGYDRYFHRLPEVLHYFGPTVNGLFLNHSAGVGAHAEGKACLDATTLRLPQLRSLVIAGMSRRDTVALLRCCDPQKLKYLGVNQHTFGVAASKETGLEGLVLPALRHLSLQTIAPTTDPLRKVLCVAATGLETLELGISRLQIALTVQFLRDYASPTWRVLKLWIRIGNDEHMDRNTWEIQPLLRLLHQNGWKEWICVYSNNSERMLI